MEKTNPKYLTIVLLFGILVLIISLPSLFFKYVFFQLPVPSHDFDCDDATLMMFDRLSQSGITATPILGNLKKNGETYPESDHVWLLADIGGWRIALDWGSIGLGGQHYEGYSLTYTELLHFVEQDSEREPGLPVSIPE